MGGGNNVVLEMVELILSLGLFSVYPRTHRRECSGLVRRLKLLLPLLEEASELRSPLSDAASNCLSELLKALHSVKTLLKDCSLGSKILLAIESEAVMGRFHAVYDRLNHALKDPPYEELNISDEVIEQVELMKAQFKRAKRRTETQDIELAMDLMVLLSPKEDRNVDSAILQRLASKLDLRTVAELKTEAKAIRELIKQRGGQVTESTQQGIDLLAKLRQMIGVAEVSMLDAPISAARLEKSPSLSIPHEFLCPITLEIMGDPVIVATGQTYERGSIQRWLASNHQTCPKSGQVLSHLNLAPNYALRNLIRQWCEKNNYELPKREAYSGTTSATVPMEEVSCLVQDLSSSHLDEWRYAVIRIRLLSKESPDNRILIAKVGGIPPLVKLLSYPDAMIQEHTVTALLNLSIDEANKKLIAKEGAIPAIIKILQNGTGEARENSAAALFSLSMLDENKVLVGSLNGIPPLVSLLQNGTTRGRKDAATALFNLSLNQGNKSRAIKAGIIPPLLRLLEDKSLGMINEALSILSLLLSHPEGRDKVGGPSFIETLVEIIGNGTPKNKECAASVLLELGSNDLSTILAALRFGAYEHLVQISRCGTIRAQRKASSLLQHISKCDQVVA